MYIRLFRTCCMRFQGQRRRSKRRREKHGRVFDDVVLDRTEILCFLLARYRTLDVNHFLRNTLNRTFSFSSRLVAFSSQRCPNLDSHLLEFSHPNHPVHLIDRSVNSFQSAYSIIRSRIRTARTVLREETRSDRNGYLARRSTVGSHQESMAITNNSGNNSNSCN